MILLLRRIPLFVRLLIPALIVVILAESNEIRGFLNKPADAEFDVVGDDTRRFSLGVWSFVLVGAGAIQASLGSLRTLANNAALVNRLLDAGWRGDRAYPTQYPFQALSPSWHDLTALAVLAGFAATLVPRLGAAVLIGYAIGLAAQTWSAKQKAGYGTQAMSIGMAFVMIVATQIPSFGWYLAGLLSLLLIWMSRRRLHDVDGFISRMEAASLEPVRRPCVPFDGMIVRKHAGFPHWGLMTSHFFRVPVGQKIFGLIAGAMATYFAMKFANEAVSPRQDREDVMVLLVCVAILAVGLLRVINTAMLLGSPIGIWHRIRSGRLIVWNYDLAFLPLLTAIALCGVWIYYGKSEKDPLTVAFAFLAMASAVMIVPPGDKETFALTVYGRVPKPSQHAQAQQQLPGVAQTTSAKPDFCARVSWTSGEFWLEAVHDPSGDGSKSR